MENFKHNIKEFNFPAPSKCWLKSFCKQVDTTKTEYGKIKDFESKRPSITFKFEKN